VTDKNLNIIKSLVAKGRLRQAINLQIAKILEDDQHLLNKAILISNHLSNLTDAILSGRINFDDEQIHKNRIANKILILVDELKECDEFTNLS